MWKFRYAAPALTPIASKLLQSMGASVQWNMNQKNGRGGWIRTNAWQDQNLLPYRLATPLYRSRRVLGTVFFDGEADEQRRALLRSLPVR